MAGTAETVAALASLVRGRLVGDGSVMVADVTHDSRQAGPGSLFIALRGGSHDGHEFVATALESGAVAVCVETEANSTAPQIVVDDTRAAAGPLAARVHGDPSHALSVIGVTGTNGKTTVTHFIESIIRAAGLTSGLIGTIQTRVAGEVIPSSLTTPEASDFQRLLAVMVERGVDVVAAEVSSHALALERVRATRFEVAAFTNLSQDHLDFHGDMDTYRAAKERLFREYDVGTAVFNVDDAVGAELAAGYRKPSFTVGAGGDVSVNRVGASLRLETPWGGVTLDSPVVGGFNESNLAVAATCCVAAGIEFPIVASALAAVSVVPGRFEVVSGDDPILVIVDYAHTPEAVARSIQTARELSNGRVLALLGAGGDRDRQKRPSMGEALGSADVAIVTSDNPRSEDPAAVAAQVASGVGPEHIVEIDRRRAIDRAIGLAEDGDIVLVLGRGHETHQQIGGEMIPFDDRAVASEALRARRSAGSGQASGSMSL